VIDSIIKCDKGIKHSGGWSCEPNCSLGRKFFNLRKTQRLTLGSFLSGDFVYCSSAMCIYEMASRRMEVSVIGMCLCTFYKNLSHNWLHR